MTNRAFSTYFGNFSVKDPTFAGGAVGNGVADDTAAIQAAIDTANAAGVSTGGSLLGANVVFPQGVYKTTAPLTSASNCSIRLIGAGRQCSAIFGSFTGYVIDKPDNNRFGFEAIEHLYVKNTSSNAASGAIRFNAAEGGLINMCYVQGFSGIVSNANANNVRISNCFITNPQGSITANQVGLAAGQVGVYNCSFQGWDTGILATNAGLSVLNCRVEVNNYGIYLNGITGVDLGGITYESNSNALYINSVTGCRIGGMIINGVNGAAPGGTNPQTGIVIRTATGLQIDGVVITATCDIARMDLFADGNISGSPVVLSSINCGSWKMPPANAKARFTYINCDQPCGSTLDVAGNVAGMSFADLPGQSGVIVATPLEGVEYDIINSNTATWGATAAGAGSNHVKVRYNGTNFTVMGK